MKKGAYSYLEDDVNYVISEKNTTVHIERVSDNVACLYFVNAANVRQPQAVPTGIVIIDENRAVLKPFYEAFFTCLLGGRLHISTQRQACAEAVK
jgi:hypothetical protein